MSSRRHALVHDPMVIGRAKPWKARASAGRGAHGRERERERLPAWALASPGAACRPSAAPTCPSCSLRPNGMCPRQQHAPGRQGRVRGCVHSPCPCATEARQELRHQPAGGAAGADGTRRRAVRRAPPVAHGGRRRGARAAQPFLAVGCAAPA
eukprot:4847804-Prymnesium_polylepis.1